MPQSPKCAVTLMKSVQKRKLKKAAKLASYYFASAAVRKKKLWRDEMTLTEDDVDSYIENLKDAVEDDTAVANVLLKWLDLRKKYSGAAVVATGELDMEAFKTHATEKVVEPEELDAEETVCKPTEE